MAWLAGLAIILISAGIFLMKRRFIAGRTAGAALRRARGFEKQGIASSLDHLGERIVSFPSVVAETKEYLDLIDRINRSGVNANIAVKPTSVGLAFSKTHDTATGKAICLGMLERIARKAKKKNMMVWIDMEDSAVTQDTIDLAVALHESGFSNVGVAIQAYLKRSREDVERLCRHKIPIRLCKGIYKETTEIAYQTDEEIKRNFLLLFELITRRQTPLAMATHDRLIIQKTLSLIASGKADSGLIEFQMLLGKRRRLLRRLTKAGCRTRVYIPYGKRWLRYTVRRLKEGKLLKLIFS